jgi:hypothetical protein
MNYVIIEKSEVSSVDFDLVLNTNAELLRYKLDGSQALLQFEGDTPSFLIGEPQYTHAEIVEIMSGAEWTDPDAII